MKDASNILIKKYFERLNGAVTYQGKTLKVYDTYTVDADALQPYITLSGFIDTEIGQGAKDTYGLEAYLTVNIWYKFGNSFGGTKAVNDVGNIVTELIRTRQDDYIDLSPNFQLIGIVKDSSQNIEELVSDGYISRKIIRFKHIIEQL